ncbi:unnamed product [Ostreococcus tauri]|uniref:Unnamed product n=1 Tax=Ostreococcus tauri TaxID=70448 RepID=A0A096P8F4_OSTTA|nr:unnamed product [Ostreococcus tauri]CEG00530.1 unnamed product [Ostreococcus tauri]|eukprot:XP_022840428.1 unnamed product [Ostreococcus tauri]
MSRRPSEGANPLWETLRRSVTSPASAASSRERTRARTPDEREDQRARASGRYDAIDERSGDVGEERSRMTRVARGGGVARRTERSPARSETSERYYDRDSRDGGGGRRLERDRTPPSRYDDARGMRATSLRGAGIERGPDGETFDAGYYKQRVARLEEKVAKEQQKVKSTVKYYEEQFEVQAKKLAEKHEEELRGASEEAVKLRTQVEWLNKAQESLKAERAAREELEQEVRALRLKAEASSTSDAEAEIVSLKQANEEAMKRVQAAEEELKGVREKAFSAEAKMGNADPAEISLLQTQLDNEKEQRSIAEANLESLKQQAIDPVEMNLLKKQLSETETKVANLQGELERAKEDKEAADHVRQRLDVTEKLVYELKAKALRVDELERTSMDAAKDKEQLRKAYDKIQDLTSKLLSMTSEKDVLVCQSAQQVHVEAQLEQTRTELTRMKNEVHIANVDRSNTEMNFKNVVDDIARALREYVMSAIRWEGRMLNEINEAHEEHAEVRRQTMNLVQVAEADAQRVLRESITAVNDARHALQETHRRTEDIIEDAIRSERLWHSEETKTMRIELVEAERRVSNANTQIDDLSEQLRQMRIDLHLAKDAHAALAATSSVPSMVDTARDYGSDDARSSGENKDAEKMRQELRVTQFQLLALKARLQFQIDPEVRDLEEKLQFMREERDDVPEIIAARGFDLAEVTALQDELERCKAQIERLESEKKNRTASLREDYLEQALADARSELAAREQSLLKLRKEQLNALDEATEDMESHVRIKMTELREELILAQAQREQSRDELNRAQDELVIARSERDDAITNVQSMQEELAEMRQTISEMTSSRSEIMTVGKEEVRLREDELDAVRRELSNIRSQKDDAQYALDEMKSRLLDTESRLAEVQERKRLLEADRSHQSKTVNERNKLECKVLALQAERDETQTKLEQVILLREQLENENKILLSKLEQSDEALKSTVAQNDSELSAANQTIASLRERVEEVENELVSAQDAFKRASVDRDVANSTLAQAREALDAREVELKLAEKEGIDKENQCREVTEALRSTQLAHKETQSELEKMEAELINLAEVVEHGEDSIEKLKSEIERKSKALEQAQALMDEKTKISVELEAERDVANELLIEVRQSLADSQAEVQLSEAYLQNATAAVEKHRVERDGLARALEESNDMVQAAEAQLQAMSAQLAELYQEVEEYRSMETTENAELKETQDALDAVLEKFQLLRDHHEDLKAEVSTALDARERDKVEHRNMIAQLNSDYEDRLSTLQLSSNSDKGALLVELLDILSDVVSANEDAQLAGDDTEARTEAQYAKKDAPPPNEEAVAALTRIKSSLESYKRQIRENMGPKDDVAMEAVRTSLRLRVFVLESLMDLVSQRSRVGAYKGQTEAATRAEAFMGANVRTEDPPDQDVVKKRSLLGFAPNVNIGLKLFGPKHR